MSSNTTTNISKIDIGGIVFHKKRIVDQNELKLFLVSDLHIGSFCFDEKKFRQHMDMALDQKARILINGDVFDAITTKDPRFYIEHIDRRLRNTSDILGKSLDLAENIIKKYAKNIDLIGIGNHEKTIINKYNFDITRSLVYLLRKYNPEIQYGGYAGIISYKLGNKSLNILYHHGWGGQIKSRGLSCFDHLASLFENIDVFWLGHLHTQTIVPFKKIKVIDNHLQERQGYFIRSGSYFNNLKINKNKILTCNPLPSYSIVTGMNFSFSGCVVLNIKLDKNQITIIPTTLI